MLWTPGNQHCLSDFRRVGPIDFSHMVGENGLRRSSRARAWNAYSTFGLTLVSTNAYSVGFCGRRPSCGIPREPEIVSQHTLLDAFRTAKALPTVSHTATARIGMSRRDNSRCPAISRFLCSVTLPAYRQQFLSIGSVGDIGSVGEWCIGKLGLELRNELVFPIIEDLIEVGHSLGCQ